MDALLTIELLLVVLAVAGGAYWYSLSPSNEREWTADQKVLPEIKFQEEKITVTNIRDITYITKAQYEPNYHEKTFHLDRIKAVWYVVESLSEAWNGAAHTMLSFEFEGPEFLAISVEIRKKKGQKFSPLKGLFRQYELMYVIADERDALLVRTNHRRDPVYLYRATASPADVRKLFVSVLRRADQLSSKPEFYNTLTNSCTTNIVKHVRQIAPGKIPLSYKVLLPGYSDELAYRVGLLDQSIAFEELRRKSLISTHAQQVPDREVYSYHIRH